MTTISLVTSDQYLSVSTQPKIASGDQNSVMLHVDFDAEWDTYARSAVFFTSEDKTVYEAPLANGDCVVPHEVLAKSGELFIGVRGVNSADNAVKTSTLVKYKIEQGAPAGEGTSVEPTPDVYQQILNIANQAMDTAQSVRHDFDAGAIPAVLEQNKKSGLMFWVGTTEEYEAQKNSLPLNIFPIITDDSFKTDILNAITNLNTFVDNMGGVELGAAPIQHDIMDFDYFTVVDDNGDTVAVFDKVLKFRYALEIHAHGSYVRSINEKPFDAKLYFYWGNGGYMVDATCETSAGGSAVLLQYSKIYGFRYPVKV